MKPRKSDTPQRLKIGWASRDISTDQPVDIPGQFHIRVSKGVLDPITATALVIDNGEDLLIFVSADLVCIRAYLVEEVRARVKAQEPRIPVDRIVINATHTHDGAGYFCKAIAGMASPDQVPHEGIEIASSDDYRAFLSGAIADAICEAYANRRPGGIAYGYGFAAVGHSRREVFFDDLSKRPNSAGRPGMMVDGHARMYGPTHDPMFSHYEAGMDPFVNLLYTFNARGKLTGAIVNVPAPSQCSEMRETLSADYWHDVRQTVRAKHGDIFILPQCAAAGDLSPRIQHYYAAQQRRFALKYGADPKGALDLAQRRDIAERIAAAFDEVFGWARREIHTALPIRHEVATINLSRRLITDEEAANEARELRALEAEPFKHDGTPEQQLRHNSILVARRNRCRGVLARAEAQKTQPTCPVELHVVRLGNLAFATNPFELYMDYMHRIQARSPFEQTFIVQLAGGSSDTAGYLATERGVWGGGYSASLYCNQVSPQGGQELVEETLKRLARF
ncbi:MAG: hypothetical protein GX571_02925 [Lentisphaerae bacterium]|nr:hypothetical protein [Lentisphaerota bacterium]